VNPLPCVINRVAECLRERLAGCQPLLIAGAPLFKLEVTKPCPLLSPITSCTPAGLVRSSTWRAYTRTVSAQQMPADVMCTYLCHGLRDTKHTRKKLVLDIGMLLGHLHQAGTQAYLHPRPTEAGDGRQATGGSDGDGITQTADGVHRKREDDAVGCGEVAYPLFQTADTVTTVT